MPTASAVLAAHARDTAQRMSSYGATVKVSGTTLTATFSSPRLEYDLGDSTVGVEKYTSILRIPKASVPAITAPGDWPGVSIELPDGAGWRTYEALPGAQDIRVAGEWRVELRSR